MKTRVLTILSLAALVAACSRTATSPPPAPPPSDPVATLAALDSAATEGRAMVWQLVDCIETARRDAPDGRYPKRHSCGLASSKEWRLAYRSDNGGTSYRVFASRDSGAGSVHLLAEGPREGEEFAGLVHMARDTAATRDDPVTGSVVPYLMWIRWCLDLGHTTRESGNAGYPLKLVEVTKRAPGCLPRPVFELGSDSNSVRITAAGMVYDVEYVPSSYGESLSEPDRPSEWLEEDEAQDADSTESANADSTRVDEGEEPMRVILEWTETGSYELRASPNRARAAGARSYRFMGPDQGLYATVGGGVDSLGLGSGRTVPACDVVRGLRCSPPSDAVTGGVTLDSLLGLPRRY